MKRIHRRVIGILFVLFFMSQSSFASHLLGGEIVWECLPSGQYRFTLTLYRDCTGVPLTATTQNISRCGGSSGSILCTKIATNYINKDCNAPTCLGATTTSGPNGTPYIGAIEQHIYRSAPVTLTGTPPPSGWRFEWSSCCRPGTVTNLQNAGGYNLRAVMYPYIPPGSSTAISANPCYDNSPDFLQAPDVTVCAGLDAEYLSLGFDRDLDSLYYDWDDPLTNTACSTPTSVLWNTTTPNNYSSTNPLPGTSQNASNVPATLDHQLGKISFKSYTTGSFATCLRIEEYRYGQLIGEIFRDIPVFIKPCTGSTNGPPSVAFGWYPGYDTLTPVYVNNKLSYYEMTVYAKTAVKFKMAAQDYDLQPNFQPQQITFVGQGGNLSPRPNYNNPSNCYFQQPCATITSLNSNGGYTSSLNNDVEFNWQTTCDHLTYQQYLGGSLKSTYEYFFFFQDDACPLPAFSYATVKINVINYPPNPPIIDSSYVSVLPNGDITFDWVPPQDTGVQFDYYVIYRDTTTTGAYHNLDTVWNYNITSYTDVNPGSGLNRYYMRTFGGCSLISDPSDTIQNLILSLTSIPPPPNSSIAMLSWNAKNPNGPFGEYYQIWREICGTGNWKLVDSTQGLSFSDTVNVCGNCLRYQIRIKNTGYSTIDSGYFADQSNNDIIRMDSVSVIGGIAVMSWDTTNTSSDVDNYIILKKDANGFWIPVDTIPVGYPFPYSYNQSNANNESESYKIVTIDTCGNQSSDLNTTAHRTLYMKVNSDPCDAFVRIRWNTYREWTNTAPAKYELFADVTTGGVTTNGVLIFQGTAQDSSYNHSNIISGSQYCYYVRVTDTTGLYTSTSNIKCIDGLVVQASRLLYLARTTVKTDESIEVFGFIDAQADVIDYGIERADNPQGPFIVLGRIPKPTTGPAEIKFSDYGASASSNHYFYRITSQDSCGNLDTTSNLGRNILLIVKANGNLTNTLSWNPYEEWMGVIDHYEVYRQVDYNGAWTLVTDGISATDTAYIDDIRSFKENKGAFCYYIKAVERDNPLGFVDEYGNPFNSRSNDACVTHEARIFIPSAFNPLSVVEENRVWKPSNVFAREDSYEMFVMNRWGDKVFSTTNVNAGWDGNFQGEPQPVGVYTFYLSYRSLNGLEIEERGSFTLYRNQDSQ